MLSSVFHLCWTFTCCLLCAGLVSNDCPAGDRPDDDVVSLIQANRPKLVASATDAKKHTREHVKKDGLEKGVNLASHGQRTESDQRKNRKSHVDKNEVGKKDAVQNVMLDAESGIDLDMIDEIPMEHYNFGVEWSHWYDDMVKRFPPSKTGYDTINYGLATEPLHHCAAKVLAAEPGQAAWAFNHTAGTNMYATLASKSPKSLAKSKVLELSSGRGGGTALLSDCFCPSEMLGLDFSDEQVKSAQARYGRNGSCPIKFVHGDATSLPFENASFDAVLSVEASHTYPSYRKFISEAHRILRPGGALLAVDFRALNDALTNELIIGNVFDKPVHPTDITSMVLRSFEENKLIKPFVKACNKAFWEKHSSSTGNYSLQCSQFAGPGFTQPALKSGRWNYRMYVMQK